MVKTLFSSLRSRLMLLVLITLAPVSLLFVYSAIREQREIGVEVREATLRLAQSLSDAEVTSLSFPVLPQ